MTSSTTQRRMLLAGIVACLVAVGVLVAVMLRHDGTSAGSGPARADAPATEAEAVPGQVPATPGPSGPDTSMPGASAPGTGPATDAPDEPADPAAEPTGPRTGDGSGAGVSDAPPPSGAATPLRPVEPPDDVEVVEDGAAIPPDRLEAAADDDRARQDELVTELATTPSEAATPAGTSGLDADAARLADGARDPSFEAQLRDLE